MKDLNPKAKQEIEGILEQAAEPFDWKAELVKLRMDATSLVNSQVALANLTETIMSRLDLLEKEVNVTRRATLDLLERVKKLEAEAARPPIGFRIFGRGK